MTGTKTYHRLGEPGGPCCPVGILPAKVKTPDGRMASCELLDPGPQSTEIELLRTIASRFGVRWGHDDLGWWAMVIDFDFPSWAVWRQDDSGNRFLMEANLTETQAHAMVLDFTTRGHKQTYWCENTKIIEAEQDVAPDT